jgi:hypothetical protein
MTKIANSNLSTRDELNDRDLDCVIGGTDSGTLLKYAILYGAERGIEIASGSNTLHSRH